MSDHRKRFALFLTYVLLALPLIAYGAMQALETNANSPIDWVSASFPARQVYDSFRTEFGEGDIVVLSWEGCTVGDERLDTLLRLLRSAKVFHNENREWLFERVTCGRELLNEMTSPELGFSQDEAIRRLRGFFIGPDDQTTCIVVAFTAEALANRSRMVALIKQAVVKVCEIEEAEQHLAGPVIDGLSVDIASRNSLASIAPVSGLIILVVCWVLLKTIPAALLVFGLSLLCQAITLAIVHYSGHTMSALLIVMPPLIQVLAVAGGIHLINYYFNAVAEHGETGAVERAFRLGWLPCVLSAGTTAIGLASLLISDLEPVRQFGGFSAVGVLLTVILLLSLIHGFLLMRPIRLPEKKRSNLEQLNPTSHGGLWGRLTQFLERHHQTITILSLVGMAVLCGRISEIQTSVRIETLFDSDSRIMRDYRWLEDHLGPLVPIEVVVECGTDCHLSLSEKLTLISRIENELSNVEGVSSSMSATNWIPSEILDAGHEHPLRRAVINRQLHEKKPFLISTHYFSESPDGQQKWRITARVSALTEMDYSSFLEIVQQRIQRTLAEDQAPSMAGISFFQTGIMPLVHRIQQQLLNDLFNSFLTAVGIIAIVMTLVQAGVIAGLVSMVSNIFPVLLLFGTLGWLQIPIDIGSVMTASIALGIAVDDTLHFLTFFRRGLSLGETPRDAVQYAFCHCGKAMIQTTFICGAGLIVFSASGFVPTSRFAWMMVGLLLAALVGDLIILPSLLLGTAGRIFYKQTQSDNTRKKLGN